MLNDPETMAKLAEMTCIDLAALEKLKTQVNARRDQLLAKKLICENGRSYTQSKDLQAKVDILEVILTE